MLSFIKTECYRQFFSVVPLNADDTCSAISHFPLAQPHTTFVLLSLSFCPLFVCSSPFTLVRFFHSGISAVEPDSCCQFEADYAFSRSMGLVCVTARHSSTRLRYFQNTEPSQSTASASAKGGAPYRPVNAPATTKVSAMTSKTSTESQEEWSDEEDEADEDENETDDATIVNARSAILFQSQYLQHAIS